MILILYTTKYRKGGAKFVRAAETLRDELTEKKLDDVICIPVEAKMDVRRVFYETESSGKKIEELHFIGHSGMYGPMFGTIAYPEQFSPWEWEHLKIPFTEGASAYFRCCRSARWFAPFFAKTFKVKTFGYYWYTTFSSNPDHFQWKGVNDEKNKLYCIGCPGKKSHGLRGSLKKYSGMMKAEEMKAFDYTKGDEDQTYDPVAELYADVFQDIKVREDEWNWLNKHFPNNPKIRVLDIGCGNGALLFELSKRIQKGCGVDESKQMIDYASGKSQTFTNLEFAKINGPELPFADKSFDVVISLLSFRYLDWDPIMDEIHRVLAPGGKFLVIDMVTVPVKLKEYPRLLIDKYRAYRQHKRNPVFYAALNKLVSHPDWKNMLKHNPIRAQHEYVWYLESRFPGQKTEILNIGYTSRILAFDSGDISNLKSIRLTYP
jgi:ubiquinone/menaquinone biosynthesis C-methylase UbiE